MGGNDEILVTQRMYYLLVRTSSEKRTRWSLKGFSLPGAYKAAAAVWVRPSSVTRFLPKSCEDG